LQFEGSSARKTIPEALLSPKSFRNLADSSVLVSCRDDDTLRNFKRWLYRWKCRQNRLTIHDLVRSEANLAAG